MKINIENFATFEQIRRQEDHFKLCNRCKCINYYKNKECVLCKSKDLDNSDIYDLAVYAAIDKEYKFYHSLGFNCSDINEFKLIVKDDTGELLREKGKNKIVRIKKKKINKSEYLKFFHLLYFLYVSHKL